MHGFECFQVKCSPHQGMEEGALREEGRVAKLTPTSLCSAKPS